MITISFYPGPESQRQGVDRARLPAILLLAIAALILTSDDKGRRSRTTSPRLHGRRTLVQHRRDGAHARRPQGEGRGGRDVDRGVLQLPQRPPVAPQWDARYRDSGLVIVGVHSPEFAHEHSEQYVRESVAKLGIRYAVVMDNIDQAVAGRRDLRSSADSTR